MQNYINQVLKELRVSTFPTQNTVINFTLFVIIFTAIMAIYLGALDLLFGKSTLSLIEILKQNFSQAIEKTNDINKIIDIATSTATSTK